MGDSCSEGKRGNETVREVSVRGIWTKAAAVLMDGVLQDELLSAAFIDSSPTAGH